MYADHTDIRPANRTDRERIRAIARESFRASYSLSPREIETVLQAAFGDESLEDRLDDPATSLLVAGTTTLDEESVAGFVDATTGRVRTIRWLHVDPAARGGGLGSALIERVREDGTPIAAQVLDDAVEGMEFLERFGLEQTGTEWTEFGGEAFPVAVYEDGDANANDPVVGIPTPVSADRADRPRDRDESASGSGAPFVPLDATPERDGRFGYACSQCGSTAVVADGLDRMRCGNCGNVRLAAGWDRAPL